MKLYFFFNGYIITDLIYLFYTKSKRKELFFHHFVCLTQNNINYYMDPRDLHIINLVYIAELLTIFNYYLLNKIFLLKF